jgi:hypothetical protein
MTRTRTGWIALLALGAAAGAPACTSRTLPLPPPNVDSVASPNAQGLVLVRGSAQEGASVGVVNDRTMAGVIVTSADVDCSSTCAFEARVEAEPGDSLRVWQFFETSSSREVLVPE